MKKKMPFDACCLPPAELDALVRTAIWEEDGKALTEMLCGAIYHVNFDAVSSIIRSHDFEGLVHDAGFRDFVMQSVFQMEAASLPDGPKIRAALESHFGNELNLNVEEPERKRKRAD